MSDERMAQLEALLRRVLETAPRCFHCDKAAVYSMPTAALGDAIPVCDEHRTSDGNEFDEMTVELRSVALHREIRAALDGK